MDVHAARLRPLGGHGADHDGEPTRGPDRLFVYATSPNGLIHKLALADGSEDASGAWPARVTLEPGPRSSARH